MRKPYLGLGIQLGWESTWLTPSPGLDCHINWAWWHMPIIPAVLRSRQPRLQIEFKASINYIGKLKKIKQGAG